MLARLFANLLGGVLLLLSAWAIVSPKDIIARRGNAPSLTATVTNTVINTSTASPTSLPTASSATATARPTQNVLCAPSWKVIPSANSPLGNNYLTDLTILSAYDAWAVGYYEEGNFSRPYRTLIEHWDGSAWSIVPSPNAPAPRNYLNDVIALAPDNVWAVGSSITSVYGSSVYSTLIEHWDGNQWSIVPSLNTGGYDDASLSAIAAVGPNDIWAVGWSHPTGRSQQLLTLHWNGVEWQPVPTPDLAGYPPSLTDVAAISANDVWAVGFHEVEDYSRTIIIHWDGLQWSIVPSPEPGSTRNVLRGLAVISQSDIWAVGYYSDSNLFRTLILHWDGSQWEVVPSPSPGNRRSELSSIVALSADNIWAAGWYSNFPGTGGRALALHWDGRQWDHVTTASQSSYLTGLAALSSSDVWATGHGFDGTANRTLVERYTSDFADVPVANTFYSQVRCLACRGIVSGYADGTFRPNTHITRGQLSKIVSSAAHFNDPPGEQVFQDVPTSSTFYDWIQRLARRGIIGGYPCGGAGEPCGADNKPYFRPNTNATRGQIAKIVADAAGYTEPANGQRFEDVPPNSAFHMWIERLSARDVMGGYSCGGAGEPCRSENRPYFRPNNNATRGQVAKIVGNGFYPNCSAQGK